MRLSSLSLVAVLLFSSVVLAQHNASAPAAPAPSAASPPPPAAPSPAPSQPISHTSSPNTPTPVSVPEIHSVAAPRASTESNTGRAVQATEAPQSDTQRDAHGVVPDERISGESRIVSVPRIGENPPENKDKEDEAQSESDLRQRTCPDGPCEEGAKKPKPPESELRHHVCLNGQCECPAGQTASNGGCVKVVNPPAGCTAVAKGNGSGCVGNASCPGGQTWNGASCVLATQCQAGQVWDGARCFNPAECAGYESLAAPLIADLRNLRTEIPQACAQNPPGQTCADAQRNQQIALGRYNSLWTGAPALCRDRLPVPGSLD